MSQLITCWINAGLHPHKYLFANGLHDDSDAVDRGTMCMDITVRVSSTLQPIGTPNQCRHTREQEENVQLDILVAHAFARFDETLKDLNCFEQGRGVASDIERKEAASDQASDRMAGFWCGHRDQLEKLTFQVWLHDPEDILLSIG